MPLDKITFGSSVPGFVKGSPSAPAVIVLQEWWGVTDEVLRQAEYLSDQTGFRVLVPDLYKGKVGVVAEEARHLMESLDFPLAIKEIGEAAEFLRKEGAPKVGVVGFCMGGNLSFQTAQAGFVDAAAPFYGTPQPSQQQPEAIKVPIQAHTGAEDAHVGFSDPETVKTFVGKIKAAGGTADFFMYPGVGHGFINASNAAKSPDAQAQADKAWTRLIAFFKKHLE